jgi:hypothetical protein
MLFIEAVGMLSEAVRELLKAVRLFVEAVRGLIKFLRKPLSPFPFAAEVLLKT